MTMTDPIADFLTRLRNANSAYHDEVTLPHSKIKANIAEILKSGNTPNHGRVGSSMSDVVTNTSMLPGSDRDAIAAYIKSLPARPTPRP